MYLRVCIHLWGEVSWTSTSGSSVSGGESLGSEDDFTITPTISICTPDRKEGKEVHGSFEDGIGHLWLLLSSVCVRERARVLVWKTMCEHADIVHSLAHSQCAIDQYFFLLVRTKGREQKVVRVEASVLKHDTRCFVNRWSLLFALFLEHLSSSSGMNGSFNREWDHRKRTIEGRRPMTHSYANDWNDTDITYANDWHDNVNHSTHHYLRHCWSVASVFVPTTFFL